MRLYGDKRKAKDQNQKEKISFHVNDLRDYFPQGYTAAQMSRVIFRLLEEHHARIIRQRDRDER